MSECFTYGRDTQGNGCGPILPKVRTEAEERHLLFKLHWFAMDLLQALEIGCYFFILNAE